MSDLFQPQSRPPDQRPTRPGYLPPEPEFFPQQLDELFSPPASEPPDLDDAPQAPSTIPRQRGSAPPRQPPLITPRHAPASQPPPPRSRRKRRGRWWLAIVGVILALLLAAGALIALDKLHLGTTSSFSASPTSAAPAAYHAVTAREWLLIAQDPDAHRGERILVYGQVKQLQAATGTRGFRASVDGVTHPVQSGYVDYVTNTVLTWPESDLHNVAQGDLFLARVTVVGSTPTQVGGKTPLLAVDTIEVTGTAK